MASGEPTRFGNLLRRYRAAAGLTQEELAGRAALSVRAIQDLERGLRRAPHPDTARRLAAALQLGEADRAVLDAARNPLPGAGVASPHRTELPLPLTSFIGRERELAEV